MFDMTLCYSYKHRRGKLSPPRLTIDAALGAFTSCSRAHFCQTQEEDLRRGRRTHFLKTASMSFFWKGAKLFGTSWSRKSRSDRLQLGGGGVVPLGPPGGRALFQPWLRGRLRAGAGNWRPQSSECGQNARKEAAKIPLRWNSWAPKKTKALRNTLDCRYEQKRVDSERFDVCD